MLKRSHFILFVRDQAASRRFYEAVLAVAPSLDVPGMTEFQLSGDCVLGLMPITAIRTLLGSDVFDQPAGGAPRAELYLQVQDPESCHQRALENGAREVSPLLPRSWGHEAAYSMDPDGHLLAFACPTRPTTAESTQCHWQDVYRKKASTEVSWYQAEPSTSLAWIRQVAPDLTSRILDVGAGTSLLVDRLLASGYSRVALLDLAPSALAEVRQRLGERAAAVDWFTGDLLEFDPPHPFDFWHDRAVLHFLREPEQQLRYAEVLRRSLAPHGHALISTFAVGGPTRCSGLDVVQYDCESMSKLLGEEFTCIRQGMEVHRTPGGGDQLFQYCLFRRLS